jgi:ankyrin repeat protein
VKLLLDRGTDIKAANNDGRTALQDAVWNGHEPVVELLIAQGADVNAADKYWNYSPTRCNTERA